MERREILQAVKPAQAIDTEDIENSRFPERVVEHDNRPTALDIATEIGHDGKPSVDWSMVRVVDSMDGRE